MKKGGELAVAATTVSRRRDHEAEGIFQRIAAGANRIKVGGGPPRKPAVLPVRRNLRDFKQGLLKCPLCEHRTEYPMMYDHIVICHPARNAKIVMAEFNRQLNGNGHKHS